MVSVFSALVFCWSFQDSFMSCASSHCIYFHPAGQPKCHFFNSFFMAKLLLDKGKYKYKNVERWIRKDQLLDCDLLFFPVFLSNAKHWALAAADMKEKTVFYYDSMPVSSCDIYCKILVGFPFISVKIIIAGVASS